MRSFGDVEYCFLDTLHFYTSFFCDSKLDFYWKWIMVGPLISCDSQTTEIGTKVYSAGLEPIAMTFFYKITLSQVVGASVI